MRFDFVFCWLLLYAAPAFGCQREGSESERASASASVSASASATTTVSTQPSIPFVSPSAAAPQPNSKRDVVLIAGGDIDLSRSTGQRILIDPNLDLFTEIRPLLTPADLRFANLESQLCDLGGTTVSRHSHLTFAGPPGGAEVVKRGRFDVLSTANNHAWDFGLRCLEETIANLERVGVAYVGTDAEGENPMRPVWIERNGQRFAFFAVTAIFNDGRLSEHKARKYIADADVGALQREIRKVRSDVDHVVVSIHIGEEYLHVPIDATRSVFVATVNAGADIVLGHHTHTPQRVEFHRGVPVVMSLGNLVFRQHRDHPWTGWGYLARITFMGRGGKKFEVCPYHLFDASPLRLTEPQEAAFYAHWDRISESPFGGKRGERSKDGCVTLDPPRRRD